MNHSSIKLQLKKECCLLGHISNSLFWKSNLKVTWYWYITAITIALLCHYNVIITLTIHVKTVQLIETNILINEIIDQQLNQKSKIIVLLSLTPFHKTILVFIHLRTNSRCHFGPTLRPNYKVQPNIKLASYRRTHTAEIDYLWATPQHDRKPHRFSAVQENSPPFPRWNGGVSKNGDHSCFSPTAFTGTFPPCRTAISSPRHAHGLDS